MFNHIENVCTTTFDGCVWFVCFPLHNELRQRENVYKGLILLLQSLHDVVV